MSGISDEMLMAYADDELSSEERARVEAYLRSSPEAVTRLEVFAQTSRGLSRVFDEVFDAPVPQRLVDAARGVRSSGVVVDFAAGRRRHAGYGPAGRRVLMPAWRGYALAASVAGLAIAVGAAFFATLPGKGPDGDLFAVVAGERSAPQALAAVLERGMSNAAAEVASGDAQVRVTPVFTFATAHSGYCRQYQIDGGSQGAREGVACRDEKGAWQIKSQVALGGPIATQGNGKIVPAGRDGAPEIEALVDAMIAGDVLSVEDEKSLIDGAWARSQP